MQREVSSIIFHECLRLSGIVDVSTKIDLSRRDFKDLDTLMYLLIVGVCCVAIYNVVLK